MRTTEHRHSGKIEAVERLAGRQAGLDQGSLDASLIPFGEFQLGEVASSRAAGQPSRSARSVKLCHMAAIVGSRSSRSSNGNRAVSTLIVSLALSFMLRRPSTGEAHRNWRPLED